MQWVAVHQMADLLLDMNSITRWPIDGIFIACDYRGPSTVGSNCQWRLSLLFINITTGQINLEREMCANNASVLGFYDLCWVVFNPIFVQKLFKIYNQIPYITWKNLLSGVPLDNFFFNFRLLVCFNSNIIYWYVSDKCDVCRRQCCQTPRRGCWSLGDIFCFQQGSFWRWPSEAKLWWNKAMSGRWTSVSYTHLTLPANREV